jgi:hypothetical protein
MYLCNTWYLLFFIQNNKYHMLHKYSFRITNLFIYLFNTRYLLFCIKNNKYRMLHKYSFRITNLFIYVCIYATHGICYSLYRITNPVCRINTILPPDDGPVEVRNM